MFGLVRYFRRKLLKKRLFPESWLAILDTHVPFYHKLDESEREIFLEYTKIFAWEKHFFGAKGFEITDEVKVVISACAIRLVLHLDLSYYDRLTEIIVYPYAFKHPNEEGSYLGEAHNWGTVVLSWPAVLSGLANPCDGHDTALHEFAHVLDRGSGGFHGTPTLRASENYAPWARIMSRHFLRLQSGSDLERKVLRDYGGTNEAEFFAVATESFFEKAPQMKALTPELYNLLQSFYGIDPAQTSTCTYDE